MQRSNSRFLLGLFLATFLSVVTVPAAPVYGPELQGFAYPQHRVQHFGFTSQGEPMEMAFMDVAAKGQPNGRTAVLMHGRIFVALPGKLRSALREAGYRVVVPDQIGFCASTKPEHYQYSFQQLAVNTAALLTQLGVAHAIVIGHSTGGMLQHAMR